MQAGGGEGRWRAGAAERRLPFNDPEPNELTRITMEKADRGEDVFYAKDFADLMRQLRS